MASGSSGSTEDNTLLLSQEILEQNEDIIAAIVENMQLGRMDDCIQHYSILHKNIIALALALDNFPAGEHSRLPYRDINSFPDEIMRKDILDELRPFGQTKLPCAPLIPACADCNNKKLSPQECRVDLGHVEPSGSFSSNEVQEFLKVAQLLDQRKKVADEPVKPKRVYRVWTADERYTVLLGISRFGLKGGNILKVLSLLPGRNEGQLRSYISKNITDEEISKALHGTLPPKPNGYVYPPGFGPELSETQHESEAANANLPQCSNNNQGSSRLEPKRGASDWAALLGIVDGQGGIGRAPVYSAGVASIGPPIQPFQTPMSQVLPGASSLLPSIPSIPSQLPPPPVIHQFQAKQQLPEYEKSTKSNISASSNNDKAKDVCDKKGPSRQRPKYTRRKRDDGDTDRVVKKKTKRSTVNSEKNIGICKKTKDVSDNALASKNQSLNLDKSVSHDTSTKVNGEISLLSSPQYYNADGSRPHEFIFDNFSQLSFDWGNHERAQSADKRSGVIPFNKDVSPRDMMHNIDIDSNLGEFSNISCPSDDIPN